MKAKIKPLSGKYYGTEIEVEFPNGDLTTIKIWYNGNFTPSIRELECYGYTKKQWEENDFVNDGWDGKSRIKEMDLVCDSHFESEETYGLARKIIDALNDEKTDSERLKPGDDAEHF